MGKCGCSASLTCCSSKRTVQDKICIDLTINHTTGTDTTQVIYINNVSSPIASGYFKLTSAPTAADTVTLTFLIGGTGGTPVQTLTGITEGEVISFTVQNFDTVTVTVPSASGTGAYLGEFCLTPRYRI